MAIIQTAGTSGVSWYVFIRKAVDGTIWNGSAFVSFNVLNWATYAIGMTEQTSSGYYSVTFPGTIPAGMYFVATHEQQGGGAAAGDPVVAQEMIDWDGTNVIRFYNALKSMTLTELSAGAPSSTPTIEQALMLIFMALRNKRTATSSEAKIYNAAGSAVTKALLSDASGTSTKESFGAP